MFEVFEKRAKPLCFLPSGRLVVNKGGKLLIFEGKRIQETHAVLKSAKETILSHSRWAVRLLRLGIRQAIALDEDHLLLSIQNGLYEYCLSEKKLSDGFIAGDRIRPLYFTEIKNVEGFDDGLVWGGYLMNMDKGPVHIYRRTDVDKWSVVYTFKQGAINHIHNIIADPYRNCLWVFTGDFGEAAAIWKITDNFKKVEKVAGNDQRYRACVAFALPEGLLYATDNPYFDNYIYMIRDFSTMEREEVAPLNGSCIYGCKWGDRYVFSSTVEGDNYENMTLFDTLFRHPLGAGIKDNFTHLYIGNLQEGFQDVFKREKDFLSYYFQFAAFMFPTGNNNSDSLYFYPMATKKNDLDLLKFTKCKPMPTSNH